MCSRACHSGAYSIDVDADACLSVTKKRLYCRRQCHVATIYLNNTAPDHYQHRRYLTIYISPFKSKFQNEIAQRDTNGMKKIPASGEVSTKNECQPPSKCTFFFLCVYFVVYDCVLRQLSLYIYLPLQLLCGIDNSLPCRFAEFFQFHPRLGEMRRK